MFFDFPFHIFINDFETFFLRVYTVKVKGVTSLAYNLVLFMTVTPALLENFADDALA